MTKNFSAITRQAALGKLADQPFDMIVVGGGITGAGIFRDAVLRGLRTLLVEREDFASGTSSKSSKLVHGGLRYLEHFHIRLTRESCRERELLLKLNPHLVRPMPFLFPLYRSSRLHPLFVRMGLRFYEFLAGGTAIPHKMLRPEQAKEQVPQLRIEGLRRVALYYDSTVDDARLVVENVTSGVAAGGQALSYTEVTGFAIEDGRAVGVQLRDVETDQRHVARGSVIVNAAGIQCDTVRGLAAPIERSELRASKGVHVVVPHEVLPIDSTVAFVNKHDGRLLFAIPWPEGVLVGTTDTFEDGDTRATNTNDIKYVRAALNSAFEGIALDDDDIVSSIAGVRTLIVPPEVEDKRASDVSREHAVYEDPGGLISVAGGKLTTYRLMARDIVDRVVRRLPDPRRAAVTDCVTDDKPLGVAVDVASKQEELRQRYDVNEAVAAQLVRTHGGRAHEPLEHAATDRDLMAPIVQGAPYLRCQVPFVCEHEAPLHVEDLLTRRLRMALWTRGQALAEAPDVARLMGQVLGWSAEHQAAEVQRYREVVAREFRPVQ